MDLYLTASMLLENGSGLKHRCWTPQWLCQLPFAALISQPPCRYGWWLANRFGLHPKYSSFPHVSKYTCMFRGGWAWIRPIQPAERFCLLVANFLSWFGPTNLSCFFYLFELQIIPNALVKLFKVFCWTENCAIQHPAEAVWQSSISISSSLWAGNYSCTSDCYGPC